MSKKYIFANWGEKVWVKRFDGKLVEGVITEFDMDDMTSCKVRYSNKDGAGFDYYNRDEIEADMQALEQVKLDLKVDLETTNITH